jgi:hypothetical protein
VLVLLQSAKNDPKMPSSNETRVAAQKGSNKRRRVSGEEDERHSSDQNAPQSGAALCLDVFSIVMSMLNPREMLRLSRCSKSLMKMVTHENVVRNTIMIGGHPKKSLKAILDLLRDRKIFFPSPIRLLRVACGQKCEIAGCFKTVHTIRSHYGVFCCFK